MRVLILLLALAACDSPAPQMMGAERAEVTRGGHDFIIYRKGNQVEVIRMGYARRGEHQAIREAMVEVVPVATGCTVVASSIKGDSGEMRGRIDC